MQVLFYKIIEVISKLNGSYKLLVIYMRKILVLIFLFIILSIKVDASTSSAHSYVLMDEVTGRVLTSKDKDSKRLIASITKIMTCVLAIESNKLDEIVVVDSSIKKAYGSGIYIEEGEEILLKDLLYGLMLRSGNDAAEMIASFVGGSDDEFVKMMNTKAREIGMKNTTFYNPSGLPTPSGNYSSAYDMALLTRYAMKYDIYKEIVSTKKYKVTTNKKTYIWNNKNKLLKYDYITGGKTGYTEESGRTLVSTANIDNMHLIVVTIRDSDDWNTHLELYNYAKDNYDVYKVLNKNRFVLPGESFYNNNFLYIKEDIYIPLKKSETKTITSHVILNRKEDFLDNQKVGVIDIYLDDDFIYEEDIFVIKNKKTVKKGFLSKWFDD